MAASLGYPPSKIVSLSRRRSPNRDVQVPDWNGTATAWKSVPCFYVQERARSSGIRVIAGNAQDSPIASISVGAGDLVDVSGAISTINGERTVGCLTQDGLAYGVTVLECGNSQPSSEAALHAHQVAGRLSSWPDSRPDGRLRTQQWVCW